MTAAYVPEIEMASPTCVRYGGRYHIFLVGGQISMGGRIMEIDTIGAPHREEGQQHRLEEQRVPVAP